MVHVWQFNKLGREVGIMRLKWGKERRCYLVGKWQIDQLREDRTAKTQKNLTAKTKSDACFSGQEACKQRDWENDLCFSLVGWHKKEKMFLQVLPCLKNLHLWCPLIFHICKTTKNPVKFLICKTAVFVVFSFPFTLVFACIHLFLSYTEAEIPFCILCVPGEKKNPTA